ncbi:MAG: hypothetical protein L0Y42_14805 [Phycisphaerales bacterium]|nr:hypothetical protein [Phycisphaerales bacterium]
MSGCILMDSPAKRGWAGDFMETGDSAGGFRWCWAVASILALKLGALPAAAQLRVVNYNIAQLGGNDAALQNVFEALHADDKPGFAVPVSVFVFQEVRNADFPVLQALISASAPPGVSYAAATYTNLGEDGTGGAQAMFFRAGLLQEIPAAHLDIYTQAGRYTDRWRLRLVGNNSFPAFFYVYGSHLKADNDSASENLRLIGAQAIRDDADALTPLDQHIIYCGDYNLYDDAEPAYLEFLSPGNAQAFDPLGTGPWNGAANAIKHSQSPRAINCCGLVGGALDDRFDFQLSTAPFDDGEGLSRMSATPFSYRSFGNDGLHFDQAINAGDNFYYSDDLAASNALADDLHEASDHIPVIVDYQLPAAMSAQIEPSFGRVIQDAALQISVDVTNVADVVVVQGADELDYTATASLGLSGVASDTVEALGDVSSPSFDLNTAVVGPLTGQVALTATSQAAFNPSIVIETTGTIVRPSNPSFSDSIDLDDLNVGGSFPAESGIHPITVFIHNYNFDALQALMDIDSATQFDPESPFQYVSGLGDSIGSTPAALTYSFDTAGLAPGTYKVFVIVQTSDEDLPGETSAMLHLGLAVTVGDASECPEDVIADGLVNVSDLLAVIAAWGPCPVPSTCPADTNDDGLVNVADLLAVIAAWGPCS